MSGFRIANGDAELNWDMDTFEIVEVCDNREEGEVIGYITLDDLKTFIDMAVSYRQQIKDKIAKEQA